MVCCHGHYSHRQFSQTRDVCVCVRWVDVVLGEMSCSHHVCAVSLHLLDTFLFIKQVYHSVGNYLFPLDKQIMYK